MHKKEKTELSHFIVQMHKSYHQTCSDFTLNLWLHACGKYAHRGY